MMGTHWSMQRLSLQNRFTLLKAGSFHVVECGLWKQFKMTRLFQKQSFECIQNTFDYQWAHTRYFPHTQIPETCLGWSQSVYDMNKNKYWQVSPCERVSITCLLPQNLNHKSDFHAAGERAYLREEILTVTRTQCRSIGSPPLCFPPAPPPSISARRRVLLIRRMLMSFSQQKAWMRVKWICRATSFTSSPSAARMHRTTLSGSLKRKERESWTCSDSYQTQRHVRRADITCIKLQ